MFQISIVHAPIVSLKLVFFVLLMMMSYCTLAIEFLGLKYYTNYLFYQFFFSPLDFFFFLLILFVAFFFPLILSIAIASFFLSAGEINREGGSGSGK